MYINTFPVQDWSRAMALHIASERVDALARELAARTGEKLTTAVEKAIEERLARLKPRVRSVEEEEQWRQLEERIARTRAEMLAEGWEPVTKEEIDELWGH